MAEIDGRPAEIPELLTLGLTNFGHFTSLRSDHGTVRGLGLHLDRLVADSREVFGADLDRDRVRELIRRQVPDQGSVTIRVTVFDPTTDLGHPDRATNPSILVTSRTAQPMPLPPLRVRTTVYERDAPHIKSTSLFGTLRQRRRALEAGDDDALFTAPDGTVSEGGTWNVGFFDGDRIIWPDAPCLPGVTMRLLQQAQPYCLKAVSVDDIPAMKAVFATNAAVGVRAVTRVDGMPFPAEHPVLDRLREAYDRVPAEAV